MKIKGYKAQIVDLITDMQDRIASCGRGIPFATCSKVWMRDHRCLSNR